jgi:hypothetical protein
MARDEGGDGAQYKDQRESKAAASKAAAQECCAGGEQGTRTEANEKGRVDQKNKSSKNRPTV